MPALRSRLPWARRTGAESAAAGAQSAGAEQQRSDQSAGAPALSVVMPIYDVEDYLDACIASVLEQTFTDLELILVDDGSTDSSATIAQAWVERDPRVHLLRQANAGLGSARNAGTAQARGEFLAYADSDDLVLPGAYGLMVRTLRSTGSDFVVGSFIRGDDETSTYVPEWVARVHARPLTGVRVEDHPEMVRDITAWNKVFRRSFWDAHGLGFPEGVRYEDQVIITKAMLLSTGFDVLDKPVYLWRTRNDGSSITQTKGSMEDLRDRLLSLTESRELVTSLGSNAVQDAWFAKWLGFDFLGYFERAVSAGDEYWMEVRATLTRLHAELRPSVLADVPLYPRLMSWLLIHDQRDAAKDLYVFNERSHYYFGWPSTRVDGVPYAQVPVSANVLPLELTRVNPADVQARCRLLEARWDGATLVLRGAALLTYVDVRAGQRELKVSLHADDGTVVEAAVTTLSDDEYDQGSQRRYEDHSDCGFEARVDLARLVAPGDGPTCRWRIEVSQRFGEVVREGGFERVSRLGTSAARVPVLVEDDREVRLVASASDVVEVQVNRYWSEVVEADDLGSGRLRLTVRGPVGDPLQRIFHLDGSTRTVLTPVDRAADRMVVEVTPVDGRARLHARHASKNRSQTTVVTGLDAVPESGPFLHARASRGAFVGPIVTTVLLNRVEAANDGILLAGRCHTCATGRFRLRLRGTRAVSDPSADLGAGAFEVIVPVLSDPWGLGRLPLPADEYVVELVDHPEAEVLLSGARRASPPARFDVAGSTWIPGGGENRVLLTAIANAPADRGARRQELLRERYAAQRHEPRLPAVLFECFYGRTVGDSPLAIQQELSRRGSDLDLVWGLKDWSVPVPPGARGVLHSSTQWYELLARATHLVSSNNFPYYFAKAPGQVHLQTWHGTPLKRIGHDIVGLDTVSRAYLRMMDASAAGWDHLVSPSPYCSAIFPGAFAYDGPILEVGYPRNDALVTADRDARRDAVRARLGIAEDRRVVLYAPTWRDQAGAGKPGKQLHLDSWELCRRAPDVTVLVRGHANTADSPSVDVDGAGPVRDVTLYPDITDLYLAADVLVTDYSSVMFDFALLDRPIYLLTPDLVNYRDESRGFYVDLAEWAPGPVLLDQSELLDALTSGAPDTWAQARARFREKFCPLDDGHAAARVVDAVWGARRQEDGLSAPRT